MYDTLSEKLETLAIDLIARTHVYAKTNGAREGATALAIVIDKMLMLSQRPSSAEIQIGDTIGPHIVTALNRTTGRIITGPMNLPHRPDVR